MTVEIRNPAKLPTDLYPAEKEFARCLAEGKPCIIGNEGFSASRPEEGIKSGVNANVVRGEVIRFFAYGGSNEHPVLGPAIHLQGAWICGEEPPLDLTHADICYALRFFHCHFVGCVAMISLKCPALYMSGSYLAKGLQAAELRTKGPVCLRDGFVADEKVDLSRAHIGGDLSCAGGKFNNGQDEQALVANLATVKGAIFMRNGFSAEGEVRLVGARVDGDVDCKGGRFNNLGGNALSADGMAVRGNICLNGGFFAEGQVKLPYARIGGDLNCAGGKFRDPNPKKYALNVFGATLGGNMFLCEGFFADGWVNISDAAIGGHLDCMAGRFHKPKYNALTASRVTTSGNVLFCKDFVAEGKVDISGANIGGNLDCAGGRFCNFGNYALNAERVVTGGHVFLNKYEPSGGDRPFFACGRVRFANADVGRNFNCKGGRFYQPGEKSAIAAAGLRTRGAVFLSDEFFVDGNVDLNVAEIGGNFVCKNCDSAASIIDLSSTKAAAVDDDPESWKPFKFILDGFTYDTFYGDPPTRSRSRLKWLKMRPTKRPLKNGKVVDFPFSPLPYEQAAKVLFGMGHDNEAREILLEKERLLTKDGEMHWLPKFGRRLWDVFAGYGYRLGYTMAWILGFIALGAGLFDFAARHNQIVPHQPAILASAKYQATLSLKEYTPMEAARAAFPDEYPEFTPLAFSLDVFMPFFALHQEPSWSPASDKEDDLRKSSILLVLLLAALATFAWLAWWFQNWIRREHSGDSGSTGVGFGMAFFVFLLGFDFVAGGALVFLDFEIGLWLKDWRWLTVWYWIEIVAGWMLSSLLLLSITSILRPRQSPGEKD